MTPFDKFGSRGRAITASPSPELTSFAGSLVDVEQPQTEILCMLLLA